MAIDLGWLLMERNLRKPTKSSLLPYAKFESDASYAPWEASLNNAAFSRKSSLVSVLC